MSRLPAHVTDPKDPEALARAIEGLLREFDSHVDEGNPGDPTGPASTTRAGAAPLSHSGTILNVNLSWVELILPTDGGLNSNVPCYHNLGLDVLAAGEPNVRWRLLGWRHDGTGTGAGTAVGVGYIDGAITSNSIELRVYANSMVVDVNHPLRVCLQMLPAERWI